MNFISTHINDNLSQALGMSLYVWAGTVVLAVIVLLLERYVVAQHYKSLFYAVLAYSVAAYTIVTSWLWFYYFALVLFVPVFVLQLLLTWRLIKFQSSKKVKNTAIGLWVCTGAFSLLAGYTFGIFG